MESTQTTVTQEPTAVPTIEGRGAETATRQATSGGPTLIIQSHNTWVPLNLHELWEYRELLYFLTWREVKGRYRQMALGPLWIVIKPIFSMVVFSAIFGGLARIPSDGLPYPIFAYTALLPWTFFQDAASGATNSLVSQMHLISKVYFPRLIIPITSVLSGLVGFTISFAILIVLMLFYGITPTLVVWTLPFYLLLAAAIALGVGCWLAAISVKFRDVAFFVNYGLMAWMYASPVIYPSSLVPERWRLLYELNPMMWVVEGFRWALLGRGRPPGSMLAVSSVLAAGLLVSGLYYFRRTERTVVDLL